MKLLWGTLFSLDRNWVYQQVSFCENSQRWMWRLAESLICFRPVIIPTERKTHRNKIKNIFQNWKNWCMCIRPVASQKTTQDRLKNRDIPRHGLISLPCDTKWDFCVWAEGGPAAAQKHIKGWGLQNRWCQIGCQLQHKWLSIIGAVHVKSALYRQHKQPRKSS